MSRIQLKPNSAEYADEDQKAPLNRRCDMPLCPCQGDHRAPKDRNLTDYYWFCLEHVQEYNKAWDYFSGMTARDIEEHIIRSALWDRPTRRFSSFSMEENLYRRAWQTYHYTDEDPLNQRRKQPLTDQNTPEFHAMAVMGLEPPLDMQTIKARYKELAKKHHPDLNKGDKKSEELLKTINMAYTILRLAFEKYEKLPPEN